MFALHLSAGCGQRRGGFAWVGVHCGSRGAPSIQNRTKLSAGYTRHCAKPPVLVAQPLKNKKNFVHLSMQGRKDFTPKLFYSLSLDSLVPQDDFYRQLNQSIDLHFLYKSTAKYYGIEGQESIDPVVFFKICMIGYLNNLCSDRQLIKFCSNSLNLRLFLGYDLEESLPWHSTISRTRGLYGEEVFLSLFKEVLRLCVSKGMVSGKRQAMDSAFIKANASLESLL